MSNQIVYCGSNLSAKLFQDMVVENSQGNVVKNIFVIVKRMVFGVIFSQALWIKITIELKNVRGGGKYGNLLHQVLCKVFNIRLYVQT